MRHVQGPASRFRSICLGSLSAAALAAAAAPALAAGERQINLPAGSLEASLAALASQTGEQLVFTPDLVAGRRAPAVSGRLTVDQALSRLLARTDVEAARGGPKLVVLKRRRTSPAATAGSTPPETGRRFFADRTAGADGRSDAPPDESAAPPSEPLPPPQLPPPPTLVDEVRITGSHIRGAAPAAPVTVLDRVAIDRSGHATIAGVLNQLPQSFGGANTEGTVATGADGQGSNTSYATGVNLRGLGSNATLVLVNGRRVGGSGTAGDFADLSGLPGIAVSRIEVLLDGASAVYGSDAVGGVVNIILRRDLEGGELRASAGVGASGSPRERQVGAVIGHGWRGGGLLLAYEAYQRDPLAAADRRYTRSSDLRPLGGSDWRVTTAFPGNVVARDPATGVVGPYYAIPAGQAGVGLRPGDFRAGQRNLADRQAGLDVLPGQRRQSVYVAAYQDVTDQLELSADARYGFRAARTHISPPIATLSVGRANPFFVSPDGAASARIQYSFEGELPNPLIRATAETLTASLGGRYRLARGWAADGYAAFAQEIDEARSSGLVNTAILAEALGNVADRPQTAYSPARDGFFNPYTGRAANAPAVMAAIGSGFTNNRTRSQIRTVNLQADGPLLRLPGGELKAALGVSGRRERFVRGGSSFSSAVTPTVVRGSSGARDVAAVFAEVRAPLFGDEAARPLLETLELSAAVRAEHYSDFGDTLDPKVGVIWSPARGIRLRTTYGESFRAPGLNQLLSQETVSPVIFSVDGRDVLALTRQGGNPDLEPETAKTWTVGLDLRPAWWPSGRLSVTAFDTTFKGRISRPVNDSLAAALTDPRFAPFVQRLSPATRAQDLAVITALLNSPNALPTAGLFPATDYLAVVDLRNVNTGQLHVRGIDADITQELEAWGGRLTLAANATRLLDYEQRLTPVAPAIERRGRVGFPATFRGRLSADWTRGPVAAGASLNHLSGSRDATGRRIEAQTTVDLRLRLTGATGRLEGTSAALTVRNLFDVAPPFYDNPLGFAYDAANADVIGRFIRLELTRAW